METNISKKQIALIMAAITSYIKEQSAQIISLNEQKKSGRWVSASRESFMLKRVMMQMRASGRA